MYVVSMKVFFVSSTKANQRNQRNQSTEVLKISVFFVIQNMYNLPGSKPKKAIKIGIYQSRSMSF